MRINITEVTNNSDGGEKNNRADAELTIVKFGAVGEIDYKKELSGETKDLVFLGKSSKSFGGSTLFCAPSDNHGLKRLSAYLFTAGKLTAIFDMNEGYGKYISTCGVGTFSIGGVKIGVLIGNDGLDCDLVKSLVFCGCGLIIDLYPDFLTEIKEISAGFYSHVFGVDYVCVATDKVVARRAGGELVEFENADGKHLPLELSGRRIYREVRAKKPGSRY